MHRVLSSLTFVAVAAAQAPPIGTPHVALAAGPFVFGAAEQHKIRAAVVARGLSHPWSLAFLPDGNKLVYFTYSKPGENNQLATTPARGPLDANGLRDVRDLFQGDWTTILGGSRIAFDRDGLNLHDQSQSK